MSQTPKPKPNIHAQHMSVLRRERALGGGISSAVDYIMTSHEDLAEALSNVLEYCANNVPYFGEDSVTEDLCKCGSDALRKARGES